LDRYGREVPDDEYLTKDFERVVALRSRTRAMARHLSDLLKGTDRFAKTLVSVWIRNTPPKCGRN